MGIYDREYARRDTPGGYGRSSALGGMRGWSATTWIIIITVLVFVIDGFLPPQLVALRTFVPDPLPVAKEQLVEGDLRHAQSAARVRPLIREEERDTLRPGALYVPLHAGERGPVVGWQEYIPLPFLQSYLHFSTQRGFLHVEFWRLIGFQFLHFNLTHLLFNMIGLFFFGPIVERHLGSKRYTAFYLLCGIGGALLYTLLNLGGLVAELLLGAEVRIPGLLFNDTWTPLIGASAGVFGILMAAAYLVPHATVLLFFILPMKMRTVAYGLVIFALFVVLTHRHNAGGEAGHLGGALAGFYFIRRPHHLHGFFDFLGRADPTSHHYREKRKARGLFRRNDAPAADQREVDRILEKISREGLQSLTDREKEILRQASRGQ